MKVQENQLGVFKMSSLGLRCFIVFSLFILLQVPYTFCLYRDAEYRAPLSVVSDISSRLAKHSARAGKDPRLPLPSPQDLDAIKKVAQILVLLGEQVIPAILGGTHSDPNKEDTVTITNVEVPNDPLNKQS